jgi:taurine--2-oxoglutarate transaminase
MPTTADIIQQNKDYTLASWLAQKDWQPITMSRAQGVYFWDNDGKRYLDWPSQLVNVNVGHGHPHVVKAIQEQAAKLCYAYPGIATEPRGKLAEMLSEISGMKKTFFTNGGTEAIENAMKMARLMTGRQKILTRYRSYHGATMGALSATGGPRRLATEPGVPWIVRLPDPYAYRSSVYHGRTQEEGDHIIADMIEEIVHYEGPSNCAAIIWESYSGSSGIIQPSAAFFTRLTHICQKYGILLILDEVMSGFGRTGEWFGIQHYPDVKVDIMCVAKGLTSGYVPLGGTMVSEEVAAYFEKHPLVTGLTYSGHALACAAGIACIEVYRDEHLIENSREMGKVLRRGLMDLAEKHPIIGDIRGTGLHQVIELVKNRHTREPLSDFNQPLSEPMRLLNQTVRENGLHPFIIWNMFFNCPPLSITEAQLQEGLAIVDHALSKLDAFYEG